jgi:hypothetical protein
MTRALGEAIRPGHPPGSGRAVRVGFAARGALDRLAPDPWLAQAPADATVDGHDQLCESELIGVLLGWQRQVAWSRPGSPERFASWSPGRAGSTQTACLCTFGVSRDRPHMPPTGSCRASARRLLCVLCSHGLRPSPGQRWASVARRPTGQSDRRGAVQGPARSCGRAR